MRFTTSIHKILLGTAAAIALSACDGHKHTSTEVNEKAETKVVSSTGNSILQTWTGPYDGVPAWDKVKVSDFPEAFQTTMDKIKAEVEAIRDNPAPATFANFTEPMELAYVVSA